MGNTLRSTGSVGTDLGFVLDHDARPVRDPDPHPVAAEREAEALRADHRPAVDHAAGADNEKGCRQDERKLPQAARRSSPHALRVCGALGETNSASGPSLFCRVTDVSHDIPRSLAFRRSDLDDPLIHVVVLQAKGATHSCV